MIKKQILLLLIVMSSACSVAQSLRKDVYGEEIPELANDYANTRRDIHNKAPSPVTVMDKQLTKFSGDPVDLSGVRAKNGRLNRSDFDAMAAKNDNSLWKEDGQSNYFFASNKAKMPGDLVTVQVDDDLRADMIQEFKKRIPEDELEAGVVVAGLGVVSEKKMDPKDASVASAVEKTPDAAATPEDATQAAATPPKTAEATRTPASDQNKQPLSFIAEVVSRYPNGNVLVRGIKRFMHNGRPYMMEVTSILKSSEIAEDDTVKSSKFFEYRTELHR